MRRKCTKCESHYLVMVTSKETGEYYTLCTKCGNEDYIGTEKDIYTQFEALCEKKGFLPLQYRKISENVHDLHLKVVLVLDSAKNEFIVYLYNFLDNAFYEGYYCTRLADAEKKFNNKR